MEISSEVREHVLVANIGERIDGSNALDFQNALTGLIDESERDVILDFENLKYISSAGLRVILMTAKTVQRQGGRLMVCSLSESVREVFKISGFDRIIPVEDSQEDAIAATRS